PARPDVLVLAVSTRPVLQLERALRLLLDDPAPDLTTRSTRLVDTGGVRPASFLNRLHPPGSGCLAPTRHPGTSSGTPDGTSGRSSRWRPKSRPGGEAPGRPACTARPDRVATRRSARTRRRRSSALLHSLSIPLVSLP